MKEKISLSSDLMDFDITGSFSLQDAISILSYESDTIIKLIEQKSAELNPITTLKDTVLTV